MDDFSLLRLIAGWYMIQLTHRGKTIHVNYTQANYTHQDVIKKHGFNWVLHARDVLVASLLLEMGSP
jgi:hypothetical protein